MSVRGYFNAASHGVPVAGVYDRMMEYIASEAENGPDRAAKIWAEPLENVRVSAAKLISAQAQQVSFFGTTTDAWHALMARMDLSGKRVLVTPHEWHSFYNALAMRPDITVEVLPPLDLESPDLSTWANRMGEDVGALFVPMVTSVTGRKYPVTRIGAMARPEGCKYIVDGAQALGQMPVNVREIGCNAFYSTTRKWLRGPRQGALVCLDDSWNITGRAMEQPDYAHALRLGTGVAIDHLLTAGIGQVQAEIMACSNRIRAWATDGGPGAVPGGTGTVSVPVAPDRVETPGRVMEAHGIVAKIVDAGFYEPLSSMEGHVLRLSPHVYTGGDDLETLFSALDQAFRD
jgi:selenocysteine lyase/cysteine desulfurase